MSLFTNTEIIIIASVFGFLVFMVILLSISILFERKKYLEIEEDIENQNIEVEAVKNEIVKEEIVKEEIKELVVEVSKVEPVKPVVEPLIMEFDEDIEKPLLKASEKVELELSKIEEELINQPNLEDTISNIETIEEEEAIISYQELLQKTQELQIVTEDTGDEPITIQEAFQKFETSTIEDDNGTYVSPISSFESDTENLNEIQLENTANLEKLDKEIRKTNEFLTILNDLKKNLD